MKAEHEHTLRAILGAIQIYSPTTFVFAGERFDSQMAPAGGPGPEGKNPLVWQLEQQLYVSCFSRPFNGTIYRPPPFGPDSQDSLQHPLSEANSSRERWDSDWRILQSLPSGQVVAEKHGLIRTLWPGEFVTASGPGVPPQPGALIRIFVPRESTTMQPNFYFAFGETIAESQDLSEAVRFYFNVTEAGAPALMRAVTSRLNRFQIPFRFKCTSTPALFYRVDSAILFIDRRHTRVVAELMVDVYQEMADQLEPETPLFTGRLAPGMAFAEEPGTGESFGTHRCRLVAEGVWNAFLQGNQRTPARLEAVRQRFEGEGIPFDRPFLRAGSVGAYEFPRYETGSA